MHLLQSLRETHPALLSEIHTLIGGDVLPEFGGQFFWHIGVDVAEDGIAVLLVADDRVSALRRPCFCLRTMPSPDGLRIAISFSPPRFIFDWHRRTCAGYRALGAVLPDCCRPRPAPPGSVASPGRKPRMKFLQSQSTRRSRSLR